MVAPIGKKKRLRQPSFGKVTLQWASNQGHGSPCRHVAKPMTCPLLGHDSLNREEAMAKACKQGQGIPYRQAGKAKAAPMGMLLRPKHAS